MGGKGKNMKQVLCFGDSLTWGYNPEDGSRFPWETRWTGILQDKLTARGVRIAEEGLCGRTTMFDDPRMRPGRNGMAVFPHILETHTPDGLVIMLGTNDCKTEIDASAADIAGGMEELVKMAMDIALVQPSKILIMSPIYLGERVFEPGFDPEFNEEGLAKSKRLADEYVKVAERYGTEFIDVSKIAETSEIDQEHMLAEGHKALAEAVYERLLKMGF